FAERSLVLSRHLPQSSEAGKGVETLLLPGAIAVQFVGQARARPDQTHFPAPYVPELRQLIQAKRTQDSPEANQSRIARRIHFGHVRIRGKQFSHVTLMDGRVSAHMHGAKLQAAESSSPITDALLLYQHGAG